MNRDSSAPAPERPARAASQFGLLRQRRFAPFFWTQFFGAANDNLFKFAFTVMATWQLSLAWLRPSTAGVVIGALFILPFLLFSATAGQLADKLDKSGLMRRVKELEIAIMLLAAWGLVTANVPLLLAGVFLMGLHSALFGPVKYAWLPQVLDERELTGGNGMVASGTFIAILLGSIGGGLLVSVPRVGPALAAAACLVLAVVGRGAAQFMPRVPITAPGLRIHWNPVGETWRNLRLARADVVVFRAILGLSWLWFLGAVLLGSFPAWAMGVLHADARVASVLLLLFCLGIGAGALLCERLSARHVELGLVPLGAIGMTVFALELGFASGGLSAHGSGSPAAFVSQPAHWRVMADLFFLSLFAGLYSVPLYALIQSRVVPSHRARVIAASNVLNALLIIVSSAFVWLWLAWGASIAWMFGVLGVLNAAVAFYIFLLVPEYLLRFVAWLVSRLMYRFRVRGDQHIPAAGAGLLVANHVSFVDAILLMAASPRPIRFIMHYKIFRIPLLGWLFRLAKCIPIASRKEDPATYERAFEQAAAVLRDGGLMGIFPEGAITRDGELQSFRGGVMKILEQAEADGVEVPVVPMALTGLWGSYFSRVEKNGAMVRPFRRGMFNRVGLKVGAPLASPDATPETLQARVRMLLEP